MSAKSGPIIKRKSVPLIGQSAESFQIGPLSPSLSDSLTNGTSIPAPEPESPTPPPTEPTMRPSTPSQQQEQAPLSNATYNRYFPSATSPSMPGTFPDDEASPQDAPRSQTSFKLQKMGYEVSATASPSPYAPSSQPSASSKSPRRPSSVFRLLPFKRGYNDRASSSADSITSGRPQTPGGDSIMGSLADNGAERSLKKKKSGSFWGRRKSSLNYVTGYDDGGLGDGTRAPARSRTVSGGLNGGEASYDGEEEFPPRLKKKKSLTFWRRTSSLGLDKTGMGYGQQQPARNGSVTTGTNGYHGNEDTVMSEPDPITLRPRSPPPQLPEVGHVVEEKGGLMGGEDWFGSIR
ncbi:MAG: hypothetical protein L6R41_002413 [Letrouitia leprolyta]|nr:MAG: hypothetical protein L6R41_002413 [Letrouitia leprolyta]